jgi:hypothetical protein
MAGYGTEIVIALAVASAAATAYSTYSASEAQADAADYNKKIAKNNAALAQQQADIDAENLQEKNKRIMALGLAEQGGMGVETESGSPLLVRAEEARQMQRDVYLTKYGGYVRSQGFEQQAGLQNMYQHSYEQAAGIGAGVSLLSSGAAIGGQTVYGRYGGYAASRYARG